MTLIEAARLDVGKKEKPGNSGFVDPNHEKEIRACGWQVGQAWCAYQIEAWLRKSNPDKTAMLNDLFVPSAVNTYRNLVRAGYKTSMKPKAGAFVFWQKYEDGQGQWQGHAGIVSEVIDDVTFKSIEGNTSGSGSRTGDGVYELQRTVKSKVENGLKVIGFVDVFANPIEKPLA